MQGIFHPLRRSAPVGATATSIVGPATDKAQPDPISRAGIGSKALDTRARRPTTLRMRGTVPFVIRTRGVLTETEDEAAPGGPWQRARTFGLGG